MTVIKKIEDVIVKVSEYTDKTTGQKKAKWLKVGTKFTHEDGKESIELDKTFAPSGVEGRCFLTISSRKDNGTPQSTASTNNNMTSDGSLIGDVPF